MNTVELDSHILLSLPLLPLSAEKVFPKMAKERVSNPKC